MKTKSQHTQKKWHIMRTVDDEPRFGESGTIYRYSIMDSFGKEVVWTWDKDDAALIAQAPALKADLDELISQAKEVVSAIGLDKYPIKSNQGFSLNLMAALISRIEHKEAR